MRGYVRSSRGRFGIFILTSLLWGKAATKRFTSDVDDEPANPAEVLQQSDEGIAIGCCFKVLLHLKVAGEEPRLSSSVSQSSALFKTDCEKQTDDLSPLLTHFFFVPKKDALPRLGRALLLNRVLGKGSDHLLQQRLDNVLAKTEWQALRAELGKQAPVLDASLGNNSVLAKLGEEVLPSSEAAGELCKAIEADDDFLLWLDLVARKALQSNGMTKDGWKEARHLAANPQEIGQQVAVSPQGWAYLKKCGKSNTTYDPLPSMFLPWFACKDLPKETSPDGAPQVALDMGIVTEKKLKVMNERENARDIRNSLAEFVLSRLAKELHASMLTNAIWSLLLVEQARRDETSEELDKRYKQCSFAPAAIVDTFDVDVGPRFTENMAKKDLPGCAAALAAVQRSLSRSFAHATVKYLRFTNRVFHFTRTITPPSWADLDETAEASAQFAAAVRNNASAQSPAPAATSSAAASILASLEPIERVWAPPAGGQFHNAAMADADKPVTNAEQAMERFLGEVYVVTKYSQSWVGTQSQLQTLAKSHAQDSKRAAAILAANLNMWPPPESTGGASMMAALRTIEEVLLAGPPVAPLNGKIQGNAAIVRP